MCISANPCICREETKRISAGKKPIAVSGAPRAYNWIGYIRIGEWACARIFAVTDEFQNEDQLWISHKKTGVVFFNQKMSLYIQK